MALPFPVQFPWPLTLLLCVLVLLVALVVWGLLLLVRLFWWHWDLLGASYYASEFHYSDFDANLRSRIVLSLVVKTRGGQQYYQRESTMSWDLSRDELIEDREIVMYNSYHDLSVLEAEGRNRALSVQRKAYIFVLFFVLNVILQVFFDVNISLLGSSCQVDTG